MFIKKFEDCKEFIAGDGSICIPPNSKQYIENIGDGDLKFLYAFEIKHSW